MEQFAQVILTSPFKSKLTYAIPSEHMAGIGEGALVRVPLGNRHVHGVVAEVGPLGDGSLQKSKIKPIEHLYLDYSVTPNFLRFLQRVADYCCAPLGQVFKMAMSVPRALEPLPTETGYICTNEIPKRATEARMRAIEYVAQHPNRSKQDIMQATQVTSAVLMGLVKQGVLMAKQRAQVLEQDVMEGSAPILTSDQEDAVWQINQMCENSSFSVALLDGVTGSGKTEVYFSAIEALYEKSPDAQVLVMLPEIVLTKQIVARFKERFGLEPTQWHSGLTESQRIKNWRRVATGNARIVIGARSALFLPYRSLQMVIVDEEHDGSYKQEEGVMYQGRDMAILRASIEQFPVILVSATPSIETVNNIKLGKYKSITLESRYQAVLPDIAIVDMRSSSKQGCPWISGDLSEEVTLQLEQSRQVMLFLNRRGYAPLTLCRACGHKFSCRQCSSWMVRHDRPERLVCHSCADHYPFPKACPECQQESSLISCGPGVQRIAAEVARLWPSASVALLDSDHTSSSSQLTQTMGDITAGKVDIIIGTQMIAKGHHFPHLSLVGIIDADLGLSGGDLRAAERCYQLLHQVSGRAGREKYHGKVMIQSYMPENSVIQALMVGDRDAFLESELLSREITAMPPFSRLVALIVTSKYQEQAEKVAKSIARVAPSCEEIQIFGPVAAPYFLIRKQYRYRLLIKARLNVNAQRWIASVIQSIKIPSTVAVKIDVDPYSFL